MSEQQTQRKVYWASTVPHKDDFGDPIELCFIDGRTKQGPWALMTPAMHKAYGRGLGMGSGQRYELQDDGKWLKVEG